MNLGALGQVGLDQRMVAAEPLETIDETQYRRLLPSRRQLFGPARTSQRSASANLSVAKTIAGDDLGLDRSGIAETL
jgi:hypothetical protein